MNQWRWGLSLALFLSSVLFLAGCGRSLPVPTPPATETAVAPGAQVSSPTVATAAPPDTATPVPPSATPLPPSDTPPPPSDTPVPPPATPLPPSATPLPHTAAPTSQPTATATPAPSATPAGPQVAYFRVSPTVTNNVGDRLAMEWQASGERAELCPIAGAPVESLCRPVPLQGSLEWTTDEAAMAYSGFGLRAWQGANFKWSTVSVALQCRGLRSWFFDDPPQRCPAAPAETSPAAGQYFENGFMIWVEQPDAFYIFYEGPDAGGFQTFETIGDPRPVPGSSPDNRLGEDPPPGLFEPVSGFGQLWRGEIEGASPDVRQRLGWATGPEFAFDTAYQCVTPSYSRLWRCFRRGPRGEVLELYPDSSAGVRSLWQER